MKILTALWLVSLVSLPVHAKKHTYDPQMSNICENSCSVGKNYDDKIIKTQEEAKDGDLVRCPVSGVVIKVKKDGEKVAYNGKTFQTCCSSCAEKFRANPEKFAENLN
jgi:YHS domain-containing protein